MPVISMSIGKIQKSQKKELIEQLSTVASDITKIPRQSFTVYIHELELENIGVGGEPLDEIKKKTETQSC